MRVNAPEPPAERLDDRPFNRDKRLEGPVRQRKIGVDVVQRDEQVHRGTELLLETDRAAPALLLVIQRRDHVLTRRPSGAAPGVVGFDTNARVDRRVVLKPRAQPVGFAAVRSGTFEEARVLQPLAAAVGGNQAARAQRHGNVERRLESLHHGVVLRRALQIGGNLEQLVDFEADRKIGEHRTPSDDGLEVRQHGIGFA